MDSIDLKRIHDVADFTQLTDKYPGNDFFKRKIDSLQTSFPTYRKVYGDGNCFYRSFAYSYLVNTSFNSFEQLFPPVRFVCLGIPDVESDEIFQERLKHYWDNNLRPMASLREKAKADKLMRIFNEVYLFDEVMVGYFRSKNYEYM